MHTFQHSKITFHFDGGYEGNVHCTNGTDALDISFEALKAFFGEYISSRRIEAIENQTTDELLGIKPK